VQAHEQGIDLVAIAGTSVYPTPAGQQGVIARNGSGIKDARDLVVSPTGKEVAFIYRGDVFAASHAGLFSAVALNTGAARWSLPLSSQSTPWPAGDVVYVISTTGQLVCVARDSGPLRPVASHGQRLRARS